MSGSNEPNCWQRRQEMRQHLLYIQPSNEKEELEQLEMALEVSRKQAELEENQRKIAILEEEILKTMEKGVNMPVLERYSELYNTSNTDNCVAIPTTHQSDKKMKKLKNDITCQEGINRTTKSSTLDSVKERDIDPVSEEDLHLYKFKNHELETKRNRDIEKSNRTIEMYSTLTINRKENTVSKTADVKSLKDCSNDKPFALKHRKEKKRNRTKTLCPYDKNCCLGKKCKYYHPRKTNQKKELFGAIPNITAKDKAKEAEPLYLEPREGTNNRGDSRDGSINEIQENLTSLSLKECKNSLSSLLFDPDCNETNLTEGELPLNCRLLHSQKGNSLTFQENKAADENELYEESVGAVQITCINGPEETDPIRYNGHPVQTKSQKECTVTKENISDTVFGASKDITSGVSNQYENNHIDSPSSPRNGANSAEKNGDSLVNASKEVSVSTVIANELFTSTLSGKIAGHSTTDPLKSLPLVSSSCSVSNDIQNYCDIDGLPWEKPVCSVLLPTDAFVSTCTSISTEGLADDSIEQPHRVSQDEIHQTCVSRNVCEGNSCGLRAAKKPNKNQNEPQADKVLPAEFSVKPKAGTAPYGNFSPQLTRMNNSTLKHPIAPTGFLPRHGPKPKSTCATTFINRASEESHRNTEAAVTSVCRDHSLMFPDRTFIDTKSLSQSSGSSQTGPSLGGSVSSIDGISNQPQIKQSLVSNVRNVSKSADCQTVTGQRETAHFNSAMNTFFGMNNSVDVGNMPSICSEATYTDVSHNANGLVFSPYFQPCFGIPFTPVVDPHINLPLSLPQTHYQPQLPCQEGKFDNFAIPAENICPVPSTESSGSAEVRPHKHQEERCGTFQAPLNPSTKGQVNDKKSGYRWGLRRPVTVPKVLQQLRGK